MKLPRDQEPKSRRGAARRNRPSLQSGGPQSRMTSPTAFFMAHPQGRARGIDSFRWSVNVFVGLQLLLLTAALGSLGAGPLLSATGAAYDRPTAYHREVSWAAANEDQVVNGLFFFQSSQKGLAARVLVASPEGRRIVLTKVLLAESGRDRIRLLDDSTGWWLEVEKKYGVGASGLWEFLRKLESWLEPESGHRIAYVLRSSDGMELTTTLAVVERSDLEHRGLVASLDEANLSSALQDQMPEGLVEAVLFLDGALEIVAADAKTPIGILAGIAAREMGESAYRAVSWTENEAPLQKGLLVQDPESRRFADGFRSISGAEPLPAGELDYWASLEAR